MGNPQDSTKSTMRFVSLETFVEHYARMALNAGAIDHARYQVRKMESDETGQWIGLGKLVAARMKEIKDADMRD
jgi:hypothetical protein